MSQTPQQKAEREEKRIAAEQNKRVLGRTTHAVWAQLKSSFSAPREHRGQQVLINVGLLVDLLDNAEPLARDYLALLGRETQAHEALAKAEDAVRSHKVKRGEAVSALSQHMENCPGRVAGQEAG